MVYDSERRFGYGWITAIVVLVSFGLLALAGCEEREVPPIEDQLSLESYIYGSEDCRELLRTDDLFLEDEYTIPFDSAVYKMIVDSMHTRLELDIHMDTPKYDSLRRFWYRTSHEYDYPSLKGTYWDAEAIIDDRFFVRTLRIIDNDTTEKATERVITRYAYFIKIGDDSRPYLGWKLWGYNGGAPYSSAMEVRSEDGAVFRGDNLGYSQFEYLVHFRKV